MQTLPVKNFETFEQMMEDQGGAKVTEYPTPWDNDPDFEIVGDYIALYAHAGSKLQAIEFAKDNNLHVVTETLGDNENDECQFSYFRGFAWINRERYFFTKKNDDFCFDEAP